MAVIMALETPDVRRHHFSLTSPISMLKLTLDLAVPSQPSKNTSSKKEKPLIIDERRKTYDEPHGRDQYPSKYR